jgi:hypothetical protein
MASWLPAAVSSALGLAPDEPSPPVDDGPKLAAMEAALADRPDVERLLRAGGEQGLTPGAGIGEATLKRWLRAEKGDVGAAVERLAAHAAWRADYVRAGERAGGRRAARGARRGIGRGRRSASGSLRRAALDRGRLRRSKTAPGRSSPPPPISPRCPTARSLR